MATNNESGEARASGSSARQHSTLKSLMLRHKGASAGAIAVLLVLVALPFVAAAVSPSRQALSDSATCSEWAAATPAQKTAYSHLYLDEYGVFPNTIRNADATETAIDNACIHAAYLGEADDVSVLAALRHAF